MAGDAFWSDRWSLDAAESQVLLTGPETSDTLALTLAIQELVLRRLLRLDRGAGRRLIFFTKSVDLALPPVLHKQDGLFGPPPIPRSLALRSVLDVYARAKPDARSGDRPGVSLERLARDVFSRYRAAGQAEMYGESRQWEGGGFVRGIVLPSLAVRGLFVSEQGKRLSFFPTRRWTLTGQGIGTLEQLRGLMAAQRQQFPRWVDQEPVRAANLVEQMGPAFLLAGTPAVLIAWLAKSLGRTPADAGTSITAASFVGMFGPGPADDFDAATRAITANVERAWKSARSGGGE